MREPDSRPASFQNASASPRGLRALRGAGGPGVRSRLGSQLLSPPHLLHRWVVLGNRNVCQSWPFWGVWLGDSSFPSHLCCGWGPTFCSQGK